jgi:hypothetical protein
MPSAPPECIVQYCELAYDLDAQLPRKESGSCCTARMAFTPHSLHKQIQIRTSNLRVLRSERYTQRHTARYWYVLRESVQYNINLVHTPLLQYIAKSSNAIACINTSTQVPNVYWVKLFVNNADSIFLSMTDKRIHVYYATCWPM